MRRMGRIFIMGILLSTCFLLCSCGQETENNITIQIQNQNQTNVTEENPKDENTEEKTQQITRTTRKNTNAKEEQANISQACWEPRVGSETGCDYQVLIKNVPSNLKVRAKPCHNSQLVYTVTDDTNLIYEGEWAVGLGSDGKQHYWCKISNIPTSGWVRSDLVMVTRDYYQKAVEDMLNLRELPQHDSTLVAKITDARLLYFYGEVKQSYGSDGVLHNWYKVYPGDGVEGWARSDLVAEGWQHG